jgi:ABC-type branched-subunit amino acid transport system substrate-binding protein
MASSSVLAEAGTCDRYGMLQIDGTCESHLIPEQHFNYTFTLQPITKSNGVGTVNLFKLIPEVHKIAFIYSDAAFNTGLGEGLQLAIDDANAHGSNYTVVYKEVFSDASTDLSSQVLKAKLANPDAFVVYAYATHCLISTRNMKEQNFSPKLCVQYSGITEPEVVTTLGKDAEDYAAAVSWTASTNWPSIVSPLWGNNSNYLNYFTTKFGVKGDYSSAGCAAVGEIMQVLLQRYHITPPLTQADRDQIKTALESGEIFNTFFGPAKFEMDSIFWHSNKGQMVQVQVQNGTVYVVGPVAIREKPIVYPRPTWAELAALP